MILKFIISGCQYGSYIGVRDHYLRTQTALAIIWLQYIHLLLLPRYKNFAAVTKSFVTIGYCQYNALSPKIIVTRLVVTR